MGKIFTLDADVKSIIQDAIDDLIGELGKDCRLVYPPKMTYCVNCASDPIGHKPSNRWKTGGPVHFPMGSLCPMCNGEGRRAEEVTEVIKLLCEWDPKKFVFPVPSLDVRTPFSVVQVKGFLTDLPKVLRCDHMVLQIPIEGIIRKTYKLSGEPGDYSNIVQGRYFVAVWTRSNQ
jgi:hypothetical protein